MPNHFHLIWRISSAVKESDFQRDFLKYTARRIIEHLEEKDFPLYSKLLVNAADRERQVWKRDSMSIPLFTDKFYKQKMNYIHNNPCQGKWMLAPSPSEYKYSSARYYEDGKDEFGIISEEI